MPINRPDKALEVRPGSLDTTSMRYHELWLQRWLYSRFIVREGYPVPVVFATPMDAFSLFSKLWADANNPFSYLFALKNAQGTPLYEPHPSPVRYPLISVMRQGVKLRPYQNFSIHRWRHVNWPTVSDTMEIPGKEQQGTELTKCNLGAVTTSRMPMAFDYRFQIDHHCLRPDTQALYLERLLNQFWRSGGGVLQSWMDIEYPGWGQQYIRIYVDGDVDNRAPDETAFQDKTVEFRTSFTLVVEGFSLDVAYETVPALWKLLFTSARPEELNRLTAIELRAITEDLRATGANPVLDSRPDIPAAGTCQTDLLHSQYLAAGTQFIYFGDPAVPANPAQNVSVPGPDTGGNQPPGNFVIEPQYAWGIPSTSVVGIPTIGTFTAPIYWISGTVTPPAASIGIEFPAIGTFTVNATTGSYAGTVPNGYSGVAVPHYWGAQEFFPPVRTYMNQTADAPNQDYAYTPIVHYRGTDSFSSTLGLGNISEYQPFNFVNAGTTATAFFGTDMLASVFGISGTSYGTVATALTGTYLDVTTFLNAGTESGTLSAAMFGTDTLVAFGTNAGTDAGTVSTAAFGTSTAVLFPVSTAVAFFGTLYSSMFGDYEPGS